MRKLEHRLFPFSQLLPYCHPDDMQSDLTNTSQVETTCPYMKAYNKFINFYSLSSAFVLNQI